MPAPAVTMATARITTPDDPPVVLDRMRLLVRGGVATVTDARGRVQWTAHLASMTKTGPSSWQMTLKEGGVATVTKYPCNCHG